MKWTKINISVMVITVMVLVCGSISVKKGVVFMSDLTNYSMGADFTTDQVILSGNTLNFSGDHSWTLTPSSGSLNTVIEGFNFTTSNMTHTTNESASVEHNITGFSVSDDYQIFKDGVLEDTDTSDINGFLSYVSDSFSGENNYFIGQVSTVEGDVCTWVSGVGNMVNQTLTGMTYKFTVNATQRTRFECTLQTLDSECNYGGTNLSSIVFPIANVTVEPFSSCNVTLYTSKTLGNHTIIVKEDQSYNQSNIGSVLAGSTADYIRRYYGWNT